MKPIFTLLVLLLSLSSCSTYYYSTVSSDSRQVSKKDNGNLVAEDDSVWIMYCFDGENAPIHITVFNKTSQPIYVDWHKSALILNDAATSYKGEYMSLEGKISTSTINYDPIYGTTDGKFSGGINATRDMSFIPPGAKISYSPLEMSGFPYDIIPDKEYVKDYNFKTDGSRVDVKSASFNGEDSPLFFKSYLTLYMGPEVDLKKPIVYEHEFYVSKLVKTKRISPKDVYYNPDVAKDIFYVRNVHGQTATEITTVVVSAAIVGVIDAFLGVPTNY